MLFYHLNGMTYEGVLKMLTLKRRKNHFDTVSLLVSVRSKIILPSGKSLASG